MSRETDKLDGAGDAADAVVRRRASVATSHPIAANAAAELLGRGGHAVDAAIAAAATLGVVDPMSAGIGGDCFAMVWDARDASLHGLNGSGRAPRAADADLLRARGDDGMPRHGILSVTVPGAVSAWARLHERWGQVGWAELFEAAIGAARDGFEVTPVVGADWAQCEAELLRGTGTDVFLVDGRAPRIGEEVRLLDLASSLEAIASGGADVFYRGDLAAEIARASQDLGGWLDRVDLAEHLADWQTPVEASYRGHPVYELPPNGQGLIVLQALRILDDFPLSDLSPSERHHTVIEAIKLAFGDTAPRIGSSETGAELGAQLLGEEHVERLRERVGRSASSLEMAVPGGGDTVFVATVDGEGNACSLIASVYEHFGARVVVPGTGICLQNRGSLFSLDARSPNRLEPSRRPFHTIIPAMPFRMSRPWLVFGVVGGFQPPQAQVQLLTNLIDEGMSLEAAVAPPRFRWVGGREIWCEGGFDPEIARGLQERGHDLRPATMARPFGGAQALEFVADRGEWVGASEPRKDGVVRHVVVD